MRVTTLLKFAMLSSFGAAQDIKSDNFSDAFHSLCSGAVDISKNCDDSNDKDQAKRDCIFTGENAQSPFSDCVPCAKAQGEDDNDSGMLAILRFYHSLVLLKYIDIAKLVNACGWDYDSIMTSER